MKETIDAVTNSSLLRTWVLPSISLRSSFSSFFLHCHLSLLDPSAVVVACLAAQPRAALRARAAAVVGLSAALPGSAAERSESAAVKVAGARPAQVGASGRLLLGEG